MERHVWQLENRSFLYSCVRYNYTIRTIFLYKFKKMEFALLFIMSRRDIVMVRHV